MHKDTDTDTVTPFSEQIQKNMLKEDTNGGSGCGGGGSSSWARICDTCRSATCTVYCHADSAYLCAGCDVRIHAANQVASRHKRVRVCEACERAPAAFLCKADAASLCASCDADIHSANPLASRHHRVPILPISGSLFEPQRHVFKSHAGGDKVELKEGKEEEEEEEEGVDHELEDDEAEAASWLLLNPENDSNNDQSNNGLFDEYLDHLVDCTNSINSYGEDQFAVHFNHHRQQQQNYGTVPDVVPGQCAKEAAVQMQNHQAARQYYFQQGFDFDSSRAGFPTDNINGSLSHQNVSISSLEVGVVPESTLSDVSMSQSKPATGTIKHLFSGPPIQMPSLLTMVDREGRVLRYREKKKARKFEKKIRYASRKAYAETRPRIKGRFAKRTDVEAEQVLDHMLSSIITEPGGYGVVPSF